MQQQQDRCRELCRLCSVWDTNTALCSDGMLLPTQDNGADHQITCLELIKPRAQLFATWQREPAGSGP